MTFDILNFSAITIYDEVTPIAVSQVLASFPSTSADMVPPESHLWKHFEKKGKEQNTFTFYFAIAILNFVFGLKLFHPKLNLILATL